MQRRRSIAHRLDLVLALALAAAILAACGGGDSTPAPGGTTGPTTIAPTEGSVVDDRPLAPDFTLTLEPEGEFVLSEADNPVYLVFWAEW